MRVRTDGVEESVIWCTCQATLNFPPNRHQNFLPQFVENQNDAVVLREALPKEPEERRVDGRGALNQRTFTIPGNEGRR